MWSIFVHKKKLAMNEPSSMGRGRATTAHASRETTAGMKTFMVIVVLDDNEEIWSIVNELESNSEELCG
jgi:hypothetical protein